MGFDVKKFGRVGVLMGGFSKEREISLKSGKAVLNALKNKGVEAVAVDIQSSDLNAVKLQIKNSQIEMAFIALHGVLGEDGQIQSILEALDISYTGTGITASRITIDKSKTQKILQKNGVQIPNYVSLIKGDQLHWSDLTQAIGQPPFIIKPVCEGSSIGISLINEEDEFAKVLADSYLISDSFLIERYIQGREMTVGILDGIPMPVVEVRHKNRFFDFSAKYQNGATEYDVPAKINDELMERLKLTAMEVYRLTGCRDFARVDFIVDDKNKHYVLEINTIPGFTATSLLPKAAALVGINFDELCINILEMAYGRKKEKKYLSPNI